MSSKIQAVLFDNKFYNTTDARKWLKKNNYKPIKKVHKTKNYLRYRIRKPKKNKNYRFINFGKNISAIIEF